MEDAARGRVGKDFLAYRALYSSIGLWWHKEEVNERAHASCTTNEHADRSSVSLPFWNVRDRNMPYEACLLRECFDDLPIRRASTRQGFVLAAQDSSKSLGVLRESKSDADSRLLLSTLTGRHSDELVSWDRCRHSCEAHCLCRCRIYPRCLRSRVVDNCSSKAGSCRAYIPGLL